MIVARARRLIGARFRLHGRDAGTGLDCVGVVAAALGRADAPIGYALRGASVEMIESVLAEAGLRRVQHLLPGDVAVMSTGPRQPHLGVWTGDGLVHADAGLRRVVERPGWPEWSVLGFWRGGQ